MKIRVQSVIAWGLTGVLTLAAIEAAGQLAYRIYKGTWYFSDRKQAPIGLVEPHPYFGGVNVANATSAVNGVRITHNSFRLRSPEFARPKPAGLSRIVTLGGSSTYCVGVSDDQTWPYLLGKDLGKPYEVVNMGGVGGTSLETSLHTALLFSDVQPNYAIYYLGWNDSREQHVDDPWPDWSGFHGKWVMAFAMSGREMSERSATMYLLKRALFHYFFPRMDTNQVKADVKGKPGMFTDQIDQRALSLYERNLRNIVALCRRQDVQPVFIPQVLNYRVLTSDKPYGWIPFVRDRDLKTVMAAYNQTMAKVAKEENVPFLAAVLDVDFGPGDFIDNGHFSFAGNQRFARVVADFLRQSVLPKP